MINAISYILLFIIPIILVLIIYIGSRRTYKSIKHGDTIHYFNEDTGKFISTHVIEYDDSKFYYDVEKAIPVKFTAEDIFRGDIVIDPD